jgi:cytosine/adenosine deaminase-related metal-dependent hydrolase
MTGSLILTGAARIVERFDDPARDRGGDLVIRRGRVTTAASAPSPEESIDTLDADGGIVTPGLVNAHHHLLQSGFRTLPAPAACRCASGCRPWPPPTRTPISTHPWSARPPASAWPSHC